MWGIQTFITNKDGQYLLHPDSQQAFQFELGGKNKITTDFDFTTSMLNPQAADYLPLQAVATKPGSLLFAAKRIHFDPSNPSRFLLLMHHLPGAVVAGQIATIPANTLLYEFMAMLLVGVIATLVLRRTFSPLKQITAAADKIAAGDQNTLLLPTDGGEIGSLTSALNTMLTSLSQRENLLRESETRYRRLHESMMDAYVMVDMSGRLIEFNHTYREMLGYSADELQRLTYADLTPEKWHDFEARIVAEQIIPVGYSQVYEKEYIRKDGTVFPVELKAFLLRDKNDQPEAMWAIVRDITERKQADDTLRLHSKILGSLSEGILLVRASDGVIVFNNPQLDLMFGYGPGELLGKHISIANAPGKENPEAVAAAITRELERTGVWHGEMQNIRKNGTVFWGFSGISTFYHPQFGKVWVSVHEDITERKRAEDLMQQFGSLLQGSFNEIYMFDADSLRFTLTSEGAEKNLGYTDDELNHFTPLDLKPSFTRESFEQLIAPLRTGEQPLLHFETVHRRKDGTTYPVEVRLQLMPTTTTTTTTTTTFLAIIQDITERKQAMELLRKSSEEIADLYNHAPCGYHSLDKDGDILLINDTELAWLGYVRDEVVGEMKLKDLLMPAGIQTFHETFPQLKKQGFIHDIELEFIRKDGTTFTGLVNATAIYDHSGDYVMSRSTVADITERKRAEQKLHDLTMHLQSVREEEKADIAREIHDDMGGTLTGMKMETYWLETKLSENEEAAPLLDHVVAIAQLVDNAMSAMRNIITGLRPTILDDLGLLSALEWQAAQFQKQNGIECRVNCVCTEGEDGAKELDKPRSIALFRIAQEALTNVTKHSGASRVEIEFHRSDEEVVMSIIDNGRGMTNDRTDTSIPYGILGMSERVDQLGGKINFDTPPGGGFNVTVILPLPTDKKEKT